MSLLALMETKRIKCYVKRGVEEQCSDIIVEKYVHTREKYISCVQNASISSLNCR